MEEIIHLDMDAFYASVEENEKPLCKNKPLVVAGKSRRAVVSTANYAARKYGIFSAMPLQTALKKYPGLIVINPDFSKYTKISEQIYKVIEKFTPEIEQASIDEFYFNVSGSHLLFGSTIEIAKRIKKDIKDRLQLTCSIGISYIKLLAKIGSNLHKPDGISIINKNNFHEVMDNLKIERIPGIGQKTAELFHHKNIYLIKDLQKMSLSELKKLAGMPGYYLYNAARGIGEENLDFSHEIKSISNEITLEYDTMDFDMIKSLMSELSESVGKRLRDKNIKGKTIKLKIRYFDFKTISRQASFNKFTDSTNEIYKYCLELAAGLVTRPVRLIGIGVSRLDNEEDSKQLKLFTSNPGETQFEKTIDIINEKLGAKIKRARTLS